MIPIKWDEVNAIWVITSANDPEWYNYSEGKWANVMLSDGFYKSELEVGIDADRQLVSNALGVEIDQQLGTIFTWVPKLMYNDTNIEYLKNISIVEYGYTTPKCFTLNGQGENSTNLEVTGMWVGKETFTNLTTMNNKRSQMNLEENSYGLIKNEVISNITDEERVVIQKLNEKTGNINNETNLANVAGTEYKQVIKIINTNRKEVITTKHLLLGDSVNLITKQSVYGIKYILDGDGNKISTSDNAIGTIGAEEQYTFYYVDNKGNIKKHIVNLIGRPNIKYFNPNTTFYVSYDADGNETSSIPIGESAPVGWFDYDNQIWANIVCRNNGDEIYYTWIPRYMYKIGTEEDNERVEAIIVGTDNCYYDEDGNCVSPDSSYILPEAFTANGMALTGYWITKYKLSEGASYRPNILGAFAEDGTGIIYINDVVSTIGTSYTYEAYVIKNGKRILGPIDIKTTDTITNVPTEECCVNIIVKDSNGKHVKGITKQIEFAKPNEPALIGFRVDTTYIITEFNDDGSAKTKQSLQDVLKTGYTVDSNNALITGEIDESKINGTWYNYSKQIWANIVTENNGDTIYFVWIPRYEYALDTTNERTDVKFIPVTQTSADSGYQIPVAFTANGMALTGYWMTKYKLSS